MLLAIGRQRAPLGLVMAFSVGLAVVLVGLVLVTAGPAASRITGRVPDWVTLRVPLISALVVTILGGIMTGTV